MCERRKTALPPPPIKSLTERKIYLLTGTIIKKEMQRLEDLWEHKYICVGFVGTQVIICEMRFGSLKYILLGSQLSSVRSER